MHNSKCLSSDTPLDPACRISVSKEYTVIAGQDSKIQEAALVNAGCTIVRAEKKSGAKREGRSEPDTSLAFLHEGDTSAVRLFA